MAANRFFLLYLPFWRMKFAMYPVTNAAISLGFAIAIGCSITGYEETCGYIFDPEMLIWRSEEENCGEQQSAIIFFCIVTPTVISNSLNLSSAAKLIFGKNFFQDCLHLIDLINCRYIFALRDEKWFQFIFLSVSFVLIYSLDGYVIHSPIPFPLSLHRFVMFYFHRDVQPNLLKWFLSKHGLRRKSNAIEAFRSSASE
uniref:7TM_GPCR_Srx domain-containing protein n=1 Tax=Caenorhabditis tropicalis TaxID=1561998 RepID=A0A1I7T4W2_9PELO